jgi:hypothetical protein
MVARKGFKTLLVVVVVLVALAAVAFAMNLLGVQNTPNVVPVHH